MLYQEYQGYHQDRNITLVAEVKQQYIKEKNSKKYFVLKLRDAKHHDFYTTSFLDLKPLIHQKIQIYGRLKSCSFLQFLRHCYVQSYSIFLLPKEGVKHLFRDFIKEQHAQQRHASLYQALFFADTLDGEYRKLANAFGISHLIAISGFHLGILSALLYALLRPLYQYVHQRYCTYRNERFDLGVIVLLILFFYLVLLDYQASFLRAFLMSVLGFLFFFSAIRVLSFKMLLVLLLFSLAFFPKLFFSLSFILSMFGIFYVFLILQYLPKMRWWLYAIVFNVCIFVLMGLVVHFYFPYFSPYQFSSIILSILFVVFFPLVLVLHLLGYGGVFDGYLDAILAFRLHVIEVKTPLSLFIAYVFLSFLSIFSKKIFYGLLLIGCGFYGYLMLMF